jgi:N-acetylneuraminate synthase
VTELRIGSRTIGEGHSVFVIAELSANHRHDLEVARALVRAAKDAGADAVKLQTYTADTLTIDSDADCFRVHGTIWDGRTLHDLYQEAYTPWEWHAPLKALAGQLDMELFSTPFDSTAVDYLEQLGMPAHKIASFELVDLPLLQCVARTGKPVILSTGMATREEIAEAVSTLRAAGCGPLALLKCTSAYPAAPDDMDLRTIPDLARSFGTVVGLSDHSMDIEVPVAAVALGASIIEKHLTLSREDPGPDSAFSLEPGAFRSMVDAVRKTERALGRVRYGATERERVSLTFRRSLFVVEDIAAGEPFTASNLRSIRPAHGVHPRHMPEIIGREAASDITRGTPLRWDLVRPPSAR